MTQNKRNYAAFILSHGRPNKVLTVNTLKRHGYTGKIYIIIDDTDPTIEQYKQNFENVIVFNKQKYIDEADTGDNFGITKTITFARNATFDIAKDLNLDYFIQLDDDYTEFNYTIDKFFNYKVRSIKSLDQVFELYFQFLDASGAHTVALAQGGDFIGGDNSGVFKKQIYRKAMNVFFCKTDKPFKFRGSMDEDVNTYVYLGHQGYLFFTISFARMNQLPTQQNPGGITETYLEF